MQKLVSLKEVLAKMVLPYRAEPVSRQTLYKWLQRLAIKPTHQPSQMVITAKQAQEMLRKFHAKHKRG